MVVNQLVDMKDLWGWNATLQVVFWSFLYFLEISMAKRKCPECNGKGEIPCPIDYGDDEEPHPDNCPVCGGDPQVRVECPDCEGTGKIED